MRTLVKTSLSVVVVAMLAVACGDKQPARDPSASDPQPQRAFNDPTVQPPNDPIANNHNPSQRPFNDPTPQPSALEGGNTQPALNDPQPQKPFYGPGTTSPDDRMLSKTEKPLSDPEILGIVVAANDGEVMLADLAAKKATATDVKQFAAMMKTHHSQGVQKTKTLATKTKLGTSDSDLSTHLKEDTASTMKDLRDKEGAAFDRAYMTTQVKAHKDLLTAIDNRLNPSVKSGEVKALLAETRTVVTNHITKAEDVLKKTDPTASLHGQAGATVGLGVPQGPEKAKEPREPVKKEQPDSDKARIKNEPRP